MSLLSNALSITRYRVNGRLDDPITDAVYLGLKKNMLPDVDDVDALGRLVEHLGSSSPWGPVTALRTERVLRTLDLGD